MLDRYIRTKAFSYIYSALLFAFAIWIIIKGWDDYVFNGRHNVILVNGYMYVGIMILVLITAFMLIASSRLTDAMLPAMIIAVLSIACYDSADSFLSPWFVWVAVPAVFAVIFHFVKYRKPIKIGRSFWGLCAVSAAVLLGGVGFISKSDYFSGTSLFYIFGLGIGMLIFYLLVKSQVSDDRKQSVARIVYLVGIIASLSILWLYVGYWDIFVEKGEFLPIQFSNNISTFIMMAMPFPLFYSHKRYIDVIVMGGMYLAIIFSGSRAGLLLGTAEFIFLLIIYSIVYQKGIAGTIRRVMYIGFMIGYFAAVWYFFPDFVRLSGYHELSELPRIEIIRHLSGGFIDSGEARVGLLKRMVRDFNSNPIFGVGIGYTGNSDLYNPVKGAMNWYHMWIPQIIGGLGAVGVIAYGYQLVSRIGIFFRNRKFLNFTFLMSYAGLFLMSQVNPGEFCPVPYGMLAVTYFAFMENPEDDIIVAEYFRGKREQGRAARLERLELKRPKPEKVKHKKVKHKKAQRKSIKQIVGGVIARMKANAEAKKSTKGLVIGGTEMLNREVLADFMGGIICEIYENSDYVYYGKIIDVNEGWIKLETDNGLRLINGEVIKAIRISAVQIPQSENILKRYWQLIKFHCEQKKVACKKRSQKAESVQEEPVQAESVQEENSAEGVEGESAN